MNRKIPYSSYPHKHYLINSLQHQTHTFLQCNSNRHFVIQNTPEITLPAASHSGVIFCVIMKKSCWKQIEKCNNRFAARDLHEGYPDSTAALLIMMIQIKFPLRLVSISLHPTVREISKKITFTCHFRASAGSILRRAGGISLTTSQTVQIVGEQHVNSACHQLSTLPCNSKGWSRCHLLQENPSPGRWCTPPCGRPSRSRAGAAVSVREPSWLQ